MNHHLVLPVLCLTTKLLRTGFFSVDLTAAVVVFFRVPHTLLTPSTRVRCSWVDLVLSLDLADHLQAYWLVAEQQHTLLPVGFATVRLTASSSFHDFSLAV